MILGYPRDPFSVTLCRRSAHRDAVAAATAAAAAAAAKMARRPF